MKHLILILCTIIALNAQAQRRQPVPTPTIRVDTAKTLFIPDSARVKKKGIDVNPVKVWKDGKTVDGVDLDVDVAYENLDNMVRFYYQLKDSTGAQIANGNVEMSGEDYEDYKSKPNHARAAYNYVLRFLRLQERPNARQ
jgi:hypothetical protein